MRVFKSEVFPYLDVEFGDRSLLILGGSLEDPEIDLIEKRYGELKLAFAGIDNSKIMDNKFYYLDFNIVNSNDTHLPEVKLAICTGVVEHLWNLHAMFQNFSSILNSGTLLWVSFPVSQFPHGSPKWYGAGYNPEMLANISQLFSFEVLKHGFTGNRRNYLFRHLLHLWPEKGDSVMMLYRWPIFCYLPKEGSLIKKMIYQIVTIPSRIILQFSPTKPSHDIFDATLGWVLLRRK